MNLVLEGEKKILSSKLYKKKKSKNLEKDKAKLINHFPSLMNELFIYSLIHSNT